MTAFRLQIVSAAHDVGLPTTSTLMFGHVEDGPASWATHLVTVREVAERTGARLTEFVPLPFVHMEVKRGEGRPLCRTIPLSSAALHARRRQFT